MKMLLSVCLLMAMVIIAGCGGERNYYHNRNGHIKHVKARRNVPWYQPGLGNGYDKYSQRSLGLWDRNLR